MLEKLLQVKTYFKIVVILYLASNNLVPLATSAETYHHHQDVCMTEKCIRAAAEILEKIDKSVEPCDDFYKFACGNFVKNLTPDYKVSTPYDVGDKIILQLMNLYEEPIHKNDTKALKILKTIYNSCTDSARIEQEGLNILKNEFKRLGGWPVIDSHWDQENFDWKNLEQDVKKTFFYSMYIAPDFKNSSSTIFTITQTAMAYGNLVHGFNNTPVKASYDYMVELAVLFGADRETALSDMKDVINFEIDLARIIITYKDENRYMLSYNPVTIRELENNFSNIPWLKSINNFLSPADEMTLDDVVNFKTPAFFERLEHLLLNVKKRTLANYMFVQIVKESVNYLPEIFKEKENEYLKIIYGKDMSTPRWRYCVKATAALKIAVSSVYMKYICHNDTKNIINALTADVKSSFMDNLEEVSWMDQKTRENALMKAEMMKIFVYSDKILDDDKVNNYYKKLELDPKGSYYAINLNISNFRRMKDAQELKKPINRPDWRARTYTFYYVANYIQNENTLELPAAVIQEYFDPERPQYMNYGALGQVLAHEMSHGFDNDGRAYNENGNSIDWWEPETNATFARESQCFVGQYSTYTIPDLESEVTTSHSGPFDGNTLADYIADNGAIKIAYRAYMKWLEKSKSEFLLPGLPYIQRQLFWISAASNWCSRYKKEAYKQINLSGNSSPKYLRVVLPFMNSEYFGKDFNCPVGSPMNPKNKCHVW